MTTDKTFHTFNDISDLVRIVSRLKKSYPDIPVISVSENSILTKLALGYVNKDLEINLLRFIVYKY